MLGVCLGLSLFTLAWDELRHRKEMREIMTTTSATALSLLNTAETVRNQHRLRLPRRNAVSVTATTDALPVGCLTRFSNGLLFYCLFLPVSSHNDSPAWLQQLPTDDLFLNIGERTVQAGLCVAKLTEREFFIYLLFAWLQREAGFSATCGHLLKGLRRRHLDQVFRLITASRESELGLEECDSFPRYRFLALLAARLESNNPIDQEDWRKTFCETRARINRKLDEAGFPACFLLASQGERGDLRYGIGVAAARISWGGSDS